MILQVGDPPFPAKLEEDGQLVAKMEHIWQAARRYGIRHSFPYISSYGVIGVAPT